MRPLILIDSNAKMLVAIGLPSSFLFTILSLVVFLYVFCGVFIFLTYPVVPTGLLLISSLEWKIMVGKEFLRQVLVL
jgi:hypothetical protein